MKSIHLLSRILTARHHGSICWHQAVRGPRTLKTIMNHAHLYQSPFEEFDVFGQYNRFLILGLNLRWFWPMLTIFVNFDRFLQSVATIINFGLFWLILAPYYDFDGFVHVSTILTNFRWFWLPFGNMVLFGRIRTILTDFR